MDKREGDNLRFYVFIQYRSGYSKYWYRRIYQIDGAKVSRNNLPEIRISKRYQNEVWARGVVFHGMSEQDCKCQKDVNFVKKIITVVKRGKQNTLEQYANNWVNDFLQTSTLSQLVAHIKKVFPITNNHFNL